MKKRLEKLLFYLFILSVFFFKIPNFYLLPFFPSSFLTTQAFSRVFIFFIFCYQLIFKKKVFEKMIRKNCFLIFLIFLFFLVQSLSIIWAVNLFAFFSRYKDVVLGFVSFFVFFSYQKEKRLIIKVFIFSLIVNYLYQFFLVWQPYLTFKILKNFVYEKHLALVEAKLINERVYTDTYDEMVVPFLMMSLSAKKFFLLILNFLFSFISNIRTRVLMAVFAFFSSFFVFKKVDQKKVFGLFLSFLLVGYFIGEMLRLFFGFSYVDRFFLEDKTRDLNPLSFREKQIFQSVDMAKSYLFGVGLGNYFDYLTGLEKNRYLFYYPYQKTGYFGALEYVHNLFGLILSEVGFFSLLNFLLIILIFLKKDVKILKSKDQEKKALLISFWTVFLYGLFNPITVGSYQFFFWGLRGLLL